MMKANIGVLDRLIRLSVGGILFYLGVGVYGGSNLGIGLVIAGLIPQLTAMVGFCPLYTLLGIRTCPVKDVP